ncbi:hypothetical protein D9611_001309 [Ephemerocybe angulata]|uniref:Beta-lactamase-related domain-containing protein n=1 Tax=Ephemerocybe angulata TaxID=980116 RepID=A0A8H5FMS9_9AGAR|nr:hypothetical protein D9611_001309 [Tulosesus angulatus]
MGSSNLLLYCFVLASAFLANAGSSITGAPATACPVPLPNLLSHRAVGPDSVTPRIQKALDSLDGYLKKRTTADDLDSLSIAVVTPAGPIFTRGYGLLKANDTSSKAVPDKDSIYRLGSISKMFTVFETLLLREKGALSLDDPADKYLAGFTTPDADYKWADALSARAPKPKDGLTGPSSKVTLRQLATHTSGLQRDYPVNYLQEWPSSNWTSTPAGPLALEKVVADLAKNPLVNLPNSVPVYSNVGFGLLGLANIVANAKSKGAAGATEPKTHKELIQRDIFDVFGLKSSFFRAPEDPAVRARLAVSSKNPIWANSLLGDVEDPAGGQYGSISDLAEIAKAFLSPTAPANEYKFLPTLIREWLRPSHLFASGNSAVGAPWEISYIAATSGPTTQSSTIVPVYSKSGDLGDYHNLFSLNPEYGYAVVVLTTGSANPDEFADEAFQALQPAFHDALAKEVSSSYVGKWDSGSGNSAETKLIDGQLFLTQLIINGSDVLRILQEKRLLIKDTKQGVRPVALWSTGRLDEFRMSLGRPGTRAPDRKAFLSCLPYWATVDFSVGSRGAPLDLVYWENGELVYPSAGVRFKKSLSRRIFFKKA